MSTFSGLSTAVSGLYANRRGLETTAHNIANANTPGFSRQRAELKAIGGLTVPGLTAEANAVGTGVEVSQVTRLRDNFLEGRARNEHATAELLAGRKDTLDRVEQAFSEPSDTALQAQFTELWNAFGDVANQPRETAPRIAMIGRAITATDTIRDTAGQLSAMWDMSRAQLDTVVTEINATAQSVADLNQAVVASNAGGQPANDLADQRDLLVLKLAELTGARGIAQADGSVDVQVGGAALVSGSTARKLGDATGPVGLAFVAPNNRTTVPWDQTAGNITAPSGKLAAVLETLNDTLKAYSDELDGVAQNLATVVNTQHRLGRDINGAAGVDLFDDGGNPATAGNITASNIHVAQAVRDNTDLVAASADPTDPTADPNAGPLDGGNADRLGQLGKNAASPDRRYRQLIVNLGVASQTVSRRLDIQNDIVSQVDASRESESGVSLDEEMTNMVAFERAYQAAAKVISAIDEMLDTLINRTGR